MRGLPGGGGEEGGVSKEGGQQARAGLRDEVAEGQAEKPAGSTPYGDIRQMSVFLPRPAPQHTHTRPHTGQAGLPGHRSGAELSPQAPHQPLTVFPLERGVLGPGSETRASSQNQSNSSHYKQRGPQSIAKHAEPPSPLGVAVPSHPADAPPLLSSWKCASGWLPGTCPCFLSAS